jgi:excisionase family DNA binding protein
MTKVILTTQDELEQIVQTSIRKVLSENQTVKTDRYEWFNIHQASSFLGLAVQTIYQKVCELEIPFHKKGKKLWFLKSELDQWLKDGRQKTRKEIEKDIKEGRI